MNCGGEGSRKLKNRRRIDLQLHNDSNINWRVNILDEESIFMNRMEWNREDRTFFGEKSIFV